MDAAQTLKKTALLLSAALAFAAPSFGQILVNGATTATITLNGTNPSNVGVTTSGASQLTYTVTSATYSAGFSANISSSNGYTTPDTLTIQASLVACAGQGNCSGTVTLKGSDNSTATITLAFTNGTSPGTGGGGSTSFSASTTALTLQQGGSGTVALTNNTAATVTYTIGTPSAGWLVVYPASGASSTISGTINGNSSVNLNLYALNYTAGMANPATFTVTSGSTTITISVTLAGVGTGTGGLVPSSSSVSLAYPGSPNSVAVTVSNGTGNTSSTFYAVASTTSGGSWLTLFPGGGLTSSTQAVGNTVLLTVNSAIASGLGTGAYYGTVTLYDGNTLQSMGQIGVSLSVNGAGTSTGGVAAPTALTYAYQSGGTAPYLAVLVNGGVTNATFTPSSGFSAGQIQPSFNTSSNLVYVTVPNGITVSSATSYTGTINITNASSLTQSLPLTLTVYPTGTPTLLVNPGAQGDYTCTYVAGQQNCGSLTVGILSSDSSNVGISTATSANWATVACTGTTTPANCTIQVDPTSLPNGLNTAAVTVTASGTTNGSVTIPIAVLVSGGTSNTGGYLAFSTSLLNFTTNATSSQTVSVTAAQGGTVGFAVTTDQTWLQATASNSNVTPSTVTVTVNPAGLVSGQTYSGHVNLMAGSTTQQITVNLTVGASTTGNVTVTAATGGTTLNATTGLTFTGQQGASNPSSQNITITSSAGSTVNFSYSTSQSWILVNNATSGSGAATTTLPVSVNPSGLTPSTTPYTGTVTISPSGGTAVTFPVSFTYSPGQTVSAATTPLTFNYTAGSGNTPASQSIAVSGNGTFTATASSTGNWCQVSPVIGSAPTTLTVSLTNLDSLSANQSYTCTITVAGTGSTVGNSTTTVTLNVSAPLPTILKVTNAASFNTGSISAGEIITLFGTGLGPSTGVSGSASGGKWPTTVGNIQVLVSGYAAPVIYASATQVSAIVPYEINRPVFLQNVNVQVKYLGQTSNGIALTQVAAAPGIFTANASGSGPGAIQNSNLSINTAANPAHPGDTVVLYVTGEGQTIPAGVTGQMTPGTAPFIVPVQAPVVTINGQPAQVVFYAEVPTLVAGIMQINVVIPQSAGTGDLPVVVSFGGASSQLTAAGIGAVTVSVR